MTGQKRFSNFSPTFLGGGAGGLGTVLNSGDATLFVQLAAVPNLPTNVPFSLTLGQKIAGLGEVVLCTAIASNQLTISRHQEGTAAQAWPVGTPIEADVTAATLNNLLGGIYNILDYGADRTGVADATSALSQALTAAAVSPGSRVYMPAGTYLLSATSVVSGSGITVFGDGPSATTIVVAGSFSGSYLFQVTGSHCSIRDIAVTSNTHTSSSNPAIAGIEISGAQYTTLQNLDLAYINGWAIEIASTSSAQPLGTMVDKVHIYHCAGGTHTLGNNTGSNNFGIQAFVSNVNAEIVDGNSSNLDAFMIEDSNDVVMVNVIGAAGQGTPTGSSLHIKGATTGVFISNMDVGVTPGPASAPTCLIETGTNGSPKGVKISTSIFQAGTLDLSITGGSEIGFKNTIFKKATTHGVSISGTANHLTFEGCTFDNNNQGAAANIYDVTSSGTGADIRFANCDFDAAIGSGAGQVADNFNITSSALVFITGCYLGGGLVNAYNSANNVPAMIRNCPNYNPVGFLSSQPTVGASPYTTPVFPYDTSVYMHSGTVTSVTLAGHSTGTGTGFLYYVPAGEVLVTTYTVVPTMIWFGN